jgi:hypothetical protein
MLRVILAEIVSTKTGMSVRLTNKRDVKEIRKKGGNETHTTI